VTASVGVALADGTDDADELINRADTAMYEAKSAGRDRVGYAGVAPERVSSP